MQGSAVLDTEPPEHDLEWWGHAAHRHPFAQLLYAAVGSASVTTDAGVHRVDTSTALWLGRGVEHACRFDDEFVPVVVVPRECRPLPPIAELQVGARARSLLIRGSRETDEQRAEVLATAAMESLGAPRALPVPRPVGALTAPIVQAFELDAAHGDTLEEWADRLHCGIASLRRAFRAETGLSFTDWRTRFRLAMSLDALSAGAPVATVAAMVGMTPNGYALAFRRVLGRSPGDHRRMA